MWALPHLVLPKSVEWTTNLTSMFALIIQMKIANVPTLEMEERDQPKEGLRASVMRIFNESFRKIPEIWSQWGRSSKARKGRGAGRLSMSEGWKPSSPFCTLPSLAPHFSRGKVCSKVHIIDGGLIRLPEGGSNLLNYAVRLRVELVSQVWGT